MREERYRPAACRTRWCEEGRIFEGGDLDVVEETGEEAGFVVRFCFPSPQGKETYEMNSDSVLPAPRNRV